MELPPKRSRQRYDTKPHRAEAYGYHAGCTRKQSTAYLGNPRGLCLYADELAAWFKNFNRYNNGSESEFWMSVFNHKVAMSDRKSSQSGVFIANPSLCGHRYDPAQSAGRLAAGNRNGNASWSVPLCRAGRPIQSEMGKREKTPSIRHRCGMA
ncbi:DUF3987 domain-containing protein [Muribaculum gordoncarteri]|uniref:DUF3987 domain-containing protein n=1 Tax=Muribaculum gordoncarteri TaxID=2530390 RepID=UPI003F676170